MSDNIKLISDECHSYFLDLGKNGGGDAYEVNGKERYAFELTPEDFSKFPDLQEVDDGSTYLLVGDDFWQFADSYEDQDDEDEDDEDEEEDLDPRAAAIATLKMVRQGVIADEIFLILLSEINEKLHENHGITNPITQEEIDG